MAEQVARSASPAKRSAIQRCAFAEAVEADETLKGKNKKIAIELMEKYDTNKDGKLAQRPATRPSTALRTPTPLTRRALRPPAGEFSLSEVVDIVEDV